MRKAGKVIFFIGVIGLVVGVVAGIVMIQQSVKAGNQIFNAVVSGNTTTISSEAGQSWVVFGDTSLDANCRIEGPDGWAPYHPTSGSSSVTINGRRLANQGTFDSPVAGEYVISCSDAMSRIAVVPAGTVGKFGGLLAGGIVAIVIGGLMFPVAVIGLIVWLVGRSRDKQPPTPPYPGHPQQGGPGGYPQQGGYPGAGGPPQPPYPHS